MGRLIIPLVAAMIGAAVVLCAGAVTERRSHAGDAFLTLLHAPHAAAVAQQRGGASHALPGEGATR